MIRKPEKTDSAESNTIATILLVVLTVILIALLLLALLSLIPDFDALIPDYEPPEYFIVTDSDQDKAIIRLLNTGPAVKNQDYSAKFYLNDRYLENVVVSTLNGYKFIPTHHYGVAKLYGAGPKGSIWYTDTSGYIDLSDGTFNPGDVLRVDIYLNTDNTLYSSTTYVCP